MTKIQMLCVAAAVVVFGAVTGNAMAATPGCTYESITDGSLDKDVGAMWANRTVAFQNRIIDCLDVQWSHHVDPATEVRNTQFQKYASTAMLAALQFDVDNFISQVNDRPVLLKAWLDSLEYGAFTWENGGSCDYERQREYLIILLQARQAQLQKYPAYKAVLSRLSAVKCRIID